MVLNGIITVAHHRGFPFRVAAEPSVMEGRAQPSVDTHGLTLFSTFWGHASWVEADRSFHHKQSLPIIKEERKQAASYSGTQKELSVLPLAAIPNPAALLNQALLTPL